MNKEFMILDDENMIVTDEFSHITKRDYNSNAEEILITENELEIANKMLSEQNIKLNNQEGAYFLSKYMIAIMSIFSILIIMIAMFVGGISHAANFWPNAIFNALKSVIYLSVIYIPSVIYFEITKTIYKKKMKATSKEIAFFQNLAKEFEEKLNDLKNQSINLKNKPLNLNEAISLEKQNELIEIQINEKHQESLNNNTNDLILKRTRKKNLK